MTQETDPPATPTPAELADARPERTPAVPSDADRIASALERIATGAEQDRRTSTWTNLGMVLLGAMIGFASSMYIEWRNTVEDRSQNALELVEEIYGFLDQQQTASTPPSETEVEAALSDIRKIRLMYLIEGQDVPPVRVCLEKLIDELEVLAKGKLPPGTDSDNIPIDPPDLLEIEGRQIAEDIKAWASRRKALLPNLIDTDASSRAQTCERFL